jgi:Tripartite tricarboxylate transporter family receptor
MPRRAAEGERAALWQNAGMATSHTRWWQGPNPVLLVDLREGDEPKIDAKQLAQDVKSFGATAFCINGGGIVAFYQTRIAGPRISSALANPVHHERMIDADFEPTTSRPEQFAAFIKSETAKWAKVVKASGAHAE